MAIFNSYFDITRGYDVPYQNGHPIVTRTTYIISWDCKGGGAARFAWTWCHWWRSQNGDFAKKGMELMKPTISRWHHEIFYIYIYIYICTYIYYIYYIKRTTWFLGTLPYCNQTWLTLKSPKGYERSPAAITDGYLGVDLPISFPHQLKWPSLTWPTSHAQGAIFARRNAQTAVVGWTMAVKAKGKGKRNDTTCGKSIVPWNMNHGSTMKKPLSCLTRRLYLSSPSSFLGLTSHMNGNHGFFNWDGWKIFWCLGT